MASCPLGGVPSVRHEFRDRERLCQIHRSTWGSPAAGSARPHFLRSGDAPPQFGRSFSAGRGTSAVSADESASICTRSPPKSRPLDSRTRLDASPQASEDGPGHAVKTARGYQVLPEPVGPQLAHSSRSMIWDPQRWDFPGEVEGSGGLR